jgi:hypothetical protein
MHIEELSHCRRPTDLGQLVGGLSMEKVFKQE